MLTIFFPSFFRMFMLYPLTASASMIFGLRCHEKRGLFSSPLTLIYLLPPFIASSSAVHGALFHHLQRFFSAVVSFETLARFPFPRVPPTSSSPSTKQPPTSAV
ncbi:uncharacterized protein SPPG_09579 [Spizellomyces punctatus DAOM BR117]|uniref:Uncharacterized protein n=1 Tax=Spizellomyces punctatus (strain DAOM BR117) TaxID=645134 RepID=A0A0L0H3M0_SPIPD|nr:uncharacterized protein SPPG_09579 [Spizellomyces punctatus DAOM BR117]KNC95797.1 hypothetical protein SPPG_09579 [Spizellomyces punctatus DAOM BR117]|eukprot:XP_016603837.1 hypothetical protein SPPG_09579 [Spizellomyces punctatus DAOM BR117]